VDDGVREVAPEPSAEVLYSGQGTIIREITCLELEATDIKIFVVLFHPCLKTISPGVFA
jgi:hypothetical protein